MWNFDENAGASVADSSSHANDGIVSGASWEVDMICQGNVLNFDGMDDYVDLGTAANGVRTIEMWFQPHDNIDSTLEDFSTLAAREISLSNHANEFSLAFQKSNVPNPGSLRFNLDGSSAVYSDRRSWKAWQWYHVAVVIHPTQGLAMYIDGEKQQSTYTYTEPIANVSDITTLGKWGDLDMRYFQGSIDEVRFSSEALYSEDFSPICAGETASASTIGLWSFNGANGGILIDSSANQLHARLHGPGRIEVDVCNSIQTSIRDLFANKKFSSVKVFPNPSKGLFNMEWRISKTGWKVISVYHASGQVILTKRTQQSSTVVDLRSMPDGIYFYQLRSKGELISVGQLIKK